MPWLSRCPIWVLFWECDRHEEKVKFVTPSTEQEQQSEPLLEQKLSRRDILRLTGVGGLGLLLGGTGAGSLMAARKPAAPGPAAAQASGDAIPFYGSHQSGILTPAQNFICFAAFDLTTVKLADVKS